MKFTTLLFVNLYSSIVSVCIAGNHESALAPPMSTSAPATCEFIEAAMPDAFFDRQIGEDVDEAQLELQSEEVMAHLDWLQVKSASANNGSAFLNIQADDQALFSRKIQQANTLLSSVKLGNKKHGYSDKKTNKDPKSSSKMKQKLAAKIERQLVKLKQHPKGQEYLEKLGLENLYIQALENPSSRSAIKDSLYSVGGQATLAKARLSNDDKASVLKDIETFEKNSVPSSTSGNPKTDLVSLSARDPLRSPTLTERRHAFYGMLAADVVLFAVIIAMIVIGGWIPLIVYCVLWGVLAIINATITGIYGTRLGEHYDP